MCQHPLHPLLQALPKCEHHIHLEGALSPQVFFKLAAKNQIKLPEDDDSFQSPNTLLTRYTRFTSLDDFLHYYFIGMSVLIDAEDFEALAWDYFQRAAADGVVHAEVFYDPQAHLQRGVAYSAVVAGFMAARRRAERELGISSELICCFLRHLPAADSLSTFRLEEVQASFHNGDVIGIGLDSSEAGFPPQNFQALYQSAAEVGIKRTAHAGEEGPAAYIASALSDLDVERVDHGIRLADDEALMSQVAKAGTLLTVCPLSNVQLRCVTSVKELPIRKFLSAGVRFSLNSDDPAYFGNHYILDNYCAVQDAFQLDLAEWEQIGENSIRGSWCNAARKEEMLTQLRETISEWRNNRSGN